MPIDAPSTTAGTTAVLNNSITPHTHGHHKHTHHHRTRGVTTSEANARVNMALRALYDKYKSGGPKAIRMLEVAWRVMKHLIKVHTTAFFTVGVLIAAAIITPVTASVPLFLCLTIVLVYGGLLALEAFHLMARSVEIHRRTLNALEDFVPPPPPVHPPTTPPTAPAVPAGAAVVPVGSAVATGPVVVAPRYEFRGSFAGLRGLLPCRSFHLRQVFRDGRYVAMPKALIVEGDDVLVPRLALSSRGDDGLHHGKQTSAGCRAPRDSALVAAVRNILDKTPIQLQPLPSSVMASVASPGRVPPPPARPVAAAAAAAAPVICDTTSEGSGEGEYEPRSAVLPQSPSTPTEQMEYFVHRGLFLLWIIAWPLLVLVCAAYRDSRDPSFWEHILLEPTVALLGLLPFNAIVVGRIWSLWSNLVLISRLRWLLRRADDDSSDDENVDSGAVVLEVAEGKHDSWKVGRSLLRMLRVDGTANYLCFARSPVHALGSVTVLASLDGEATLTEAVPVPLRVLYIKSRPEDVQENGPTASDDNDAQRADATEALHPDLIALLEKQRREAELYRRAQLYGTQRFQVLELHHNSNKSKIVSFVDGRTAVGDSATSSLMPLGLCALLHSVHGTSALRGRDVRSRELIASHAMDATVMWGRCIHWLARALDIPDGVAIGFRLLRRMLFFERSPARKATAHTSRPIPQKCGLVFEAPAGELHLYVIGSLPYVMDGCASCWDGGGVGALSDQDRQTALGLTSRWPISADVVGCSFRVLPERYREFLVPAAGTAGGPAGKSVKTAQWANVAEDIYVDGGHLVYSTHPPPPESPPIGTDAIRPSTPGLDGRPGGHHRRHHHHRRSWATDGNTSSPALTPATTPVLSPAVVDSGAADAPVTRLEKDKVPDFEPDSHLTVHNAVSLVMSCQQTFLGAVGLYDFVRPKVENSIRTLNSAGVRFVHFGSGTLPEVRSFGARLGLKDEHNNCISLREQDPSIDDAYVRARLPRGVDGIRRHLVTTDTIPLKVPMFCGARSARTRGMISVMQDNHEVVVAVGSTFNHSNVRAMLQADLTIAAEPNLRRGAAVDGDDIVNRQVDEMFFRPDIDTSANLQHLNRLLSTVCALRLTPTTQTLPMVVALIRQARLLLKQLAQATDFIVQCSCAITFIQAASLVASGGPLLLPPSMTLVLLNFTVPILALGVAYSPMSGNVMNLFPTKHDHATRVRMMTHWITWFAIRFLPTSLMILVVGIGARASIGDDRMQPFHQSLSLDDTDPVIQACAAFSSIAIAYSLAWISMTFLARHEVVPLFVTDASKRSKVRSALSCHRWMICCGAAFVINLCLVLIVSRNVLSLLTDIPWACYGLVAVWPVFIVAVDRPMKKRRAASYSFEQKMLNLAFQTRLGMYSPVGSEDAGLDETRHEEESQVKVENCAARFVREFVSMDDGKGERQCVCQLRGDY